MSASVKFLLPYDRGGNHIALPENSPLGPLWVGSGRFHTLKMFGCVTNSGRAETAFRVEVCPNATPFIRACLVAFPN